jgi:hypothetical protein
MLYEFSRKEVIVSSYVPGGGFLVEYVEGCGGLGGEGGERPIRESRVCAERSQHFFCLVEIQRAK